MEENASAENTIRKRRFSFGSGKSFYYIYFLAQFNFKKSFTEGKTNTYILLAYTFKIKIKHLLLTP